MNKNLSIKEIEQKISGKSTDEALHILYSIKNDKRKSYIKLIKKYEKIKLDIQNEIERFNRMCVFEKKLFNKGYKLIAGIDEAGRGPLAGPVVAASVILPENVFIPGLDDSKKLAPEKRDQLYDVISEKAIALSTGIVDVEVIDSINILNATKMAMETAVRKLAPKPEYILIDAVELPQFSIKQKAIIKGDSKSISIAAASIIAKVTRDRILDKLHNEYPDYGFVHHKGYGTKQHVDAIKKYGVCPIHRMSFLKNII